MSTATVARAAIAASQDAPTVGALPSSATLAAALDADGYALTGELLDARGCAQLAGCYEHESTFRSRVVMARHGYGSGEYRYFAYPLPEVVARLRGALYAALAPIANDWAQRLRSEVRYPATHAEYLERCARAGQSRPTPLLLRYRAGDWNALHRDVYGAELFPLQLAVLLSEPGRDFAGGEFVLTEQRPRRQSRARVVPLARGQGVIFPVRDRPVAGKRGEHRVQLRHGVSAVTRGERHVLGIILHDAT